MRENDNCGEVIYMGVVQGPEKVNDDTCVNTMQRQRWIEVSLYCYFTFCVLVLLFLETMLFYNV
jgi:hypothetical protein